MARSMNNYSTMISGYTLSQYIDWGTRLSGALRAALPRTNDSGQVNWSAVSSIQPGGVVRDYEVFGFTDSLQATKPIYIRLDWGLQTASTSGPSMQIQVGTSTNGSGILSGITYGVSAVAANTLGSTNSTMVFAATTSNTVNPRYCYASSDGSYLAFFANIQQAGVGLAQNASDAMAAFVVERTRDIDGTPNGNGYVVWRWMAASDANGLSTSSFAGTTMRVYDTSVPNTYQPNNQFEYGALVPSGTGTTTIPMGGSAQAFPCYGFTMQPQGASKALALAYMADVPRMGQVTLTHYGAPSQWISCGSGQPAYVANSSAPGTSSVRTTVFSPVFRWE